MAKSRCLLLVSKLQEHLAARMLIPFLRSCVMTTGPIAIQSAKSVRLSKREREFEDLLRRANENLQLQQFKQSKASAAGPEKGT